MCVVSASLFSIVSLYIVYSIHLFFMFPRLEEGGLATYRAALVQNQHLTVLAEVHLSDHSQ